MKQLIHLLLFCASPILLSAQFQTAATIHEGFESFQRSIMSDVDQDGDMEVFCLVDEELRFFKAHQGNMERYYLHQTLDFASSSNMPIHSRDLDLDGDLDLLLFKDGGLYWIPYDAGQDELLTPLLLAQIATEDPVYTLEVDFTPGVEIELLSAQSDSVFQIRVTPEVGSPNLTVHPITTLPAGIRRMGLGDISGDGNEDLIFYENNNISWAPQTSNAPLEFGAPVLVQSNAPDVYSLTSAHMDSNNALDIVAAQSHLNFNVNLYQNRVYWLKNGDGAGTVWSNPKLIVTPLGHLGAITFLDLDQDGDMDLFLNDQEAGPCWSEFEAGEYQDPVQLIDDLETYEICEGRMQQIQDLNNDGTLDFLYLRNLDTSLELRWYSNTVPDDGEIHPSTIITHNLAFLYEADAADIDQDGDMDIVAAYGRNYTGYAPFDEMLVIYEYLSDVERYTTHTSIRYNPNQDGSHPVYRAAAYFIDWDEDGDQDVISEINWRTTWMENLDGQGTFSDPQFMSQIYDYPTNSVYGILLADLNNDGLQDLIAEDAVKINTAGSGTWTNSNADPNPVNYKWFQTIDYDDDGDRDIILRRNTSIDGVSVCFNLDGTGTDWYVNIEPVPNINTVAFSSEFYAFDYDQDGDEDILYHNIDGFFTTIYWYENFGNGSWPLEPTEIVSHIIPENGPNYAHGVHNMYFEDFDGDGWTDILLGTNGVNLQTLYFNTPNQIDLAYPIQLLPDLEINTVGVTDMDGDDDPDVLAADFSRRGDLIWVRNDLVDVPVDQGEIIQYFVYIDTDENQQYDPGTDPLYPNTGVALIDQNMLGFTNPAGVGIFEVEDPGVYTLEVQLPQNFEPTTTTQIEVDTDTLDQQTFLSFGIISHGFLYEGTSSYFYEWPRCMETIYHRIQGINQSTTTVDMWIEVSFEYNQPTPLGPPAFIPGNEPDSISGDAYLWFFEDLDPNYSGSAELELVMPSFIVNVPQILYWQYTIWYYDENGDLVSVDGETFNYEIICGYDPNDKQVRPFRDSTHNYFVESDEEFEYVIRFQNT
ncbi:MAG: VCBS repeat-containing protein, partial [Phaeodactylibacter sp.]|nr:VCBS repeat-containing protein [Phaeodactylibacter sp.]